MHISRILVNMVSIFLLLSVQSAWSASKTVFTKAEFYPALSDGYGEAWANTSETERDTGKPVINELAPNEKIPATGGWQVTIVHACPMDGSDNFTSNNYGKVMTFTNSGYVLNYGDHFEYLFESQGVSPSVIDGVDKELADRRSELAGEFNDVQVKLVKQDNGKFGLVASYPYAQGVSASEISKRLGYFISKSGFAMCDIYTASESLSWKQLKAIKSGEIVAPLTKDQFTSLYPLMKEPGYETEGEAPEGQWAFSGDDDGNFGILVENFGDSMKLWVRAPIMEATGLEYMTEESGTVVEQETMKQIKPWEKAQKVETTWSTGNFWVGFVYPYAGMKGKDVASLVKGFIDDDGAEDTYDDVKKIMKEFGK